MEKDAVVRIAVRGIKKVANVRYTVRITSKKKLQKTRNKSWF